MGSKLWSLGLLGLILFAVLSSAATHALESRGIDTYDQAPGLHKRLVAVKLGNNIEKRHLFKGDCLSHDHVLHFTHGKWQQRCYDPSSH